VIVARALQGKVSPRPGSGAFPQDPAARSAVEARRAEANARFRASLATMPIHPIRRLVTRPGECQWDRLQAAQPPRPSRLEQYGLPALFTPDDVVAFLGLASYKQLVHLCDLQGHVIENHKASNYRVRQIPKSDGSMRELHIPKPRLKEVQRRILREILDRIPPHAAATAFRRGGDAAVNARPHVGRAVVLCYDLRNFFPSIRRRRVDAFFQWLGYNPKVARILSLLCTVRGSFGYRALPQGAPTSPAIANALCHRLDCRLAGLARRFEAQYTRYADDITFSGDAIFKRGLSRFVPLAETIIHGEEFHLHRGKRRFMRSGRTQRVTGLIVNQKVSLGREEFDLIKAILHNARKAGSLESQNLEKHPNFRAHLIGRIGWIGRFHPERAARLRAQLDQLA